MHRLRQLLLTTTIVAVVALGAPATAAMATQASSIYPPSDSCTTTPATFGPGESTTFACKPDTFSSSETVTVTVTGENGRDVTFGMVRFAVTTSSTTESRADGSLDGVRITFPSTARGTYNIAAFSTTSAGGAAAVTVTNPDGSLAGTGLDSSTMMGVWIGGGVLLLVGALLAITAVVRRRRDDH